MTKMITKIETFLSSESGATSVEYAVMLMLIIAACIAAITAVGGQSGSMWGNNSNEITTAFN